VSYMESAYSPLAQNCTLYWASWIQFIK